MRSPRMVWAEGRLFTLREWAEHNQANYNSVTTRWEYGVRNPQKLVEGLCGDYELSASDFEYLTETERYRRGQYNEWQIACELIGWPESRAEELRRKVRAIRQERKTG